MAPAGDADSVGVTILVGETMTVGLGVAIILFSTGFLVCINANAAPPKTMRRKRMKSIGKSGDFFFVTTGVGGVVANAGVETGETGVATTGGGGITGAGVSATLGDVATGVSEAGTGATGVV